MPLLWFKVNRSLRLPSLELRFNRSLQINHFDCKILVRNVLHFYLKIKHDMIHIKIYISILLRPINKRLSKVPFLLRCLQLQIQTKTAGQHLTHRVQPGHDDLIETASTKMLVKILIFCIKFLK